MICCDQLNIFIFFRNAHIRIKVLNIHSKLSVSNSISLQFIQPQNGLFPHQNNKFHSSSIPLETSSLLNRIPSNLFDPPNKKVSGPKKKKNNKIISSFKVSNLSEKANLENPSRRVSCLGRHEQATIQQIQKKKAVPQKNEPRMRSWWKLKLYCEEERSSSEWYVVLTIYTVERNGRCERKSCQASDFHRQRYKSHL